MRIVVDQPGMRSAAAALDDSGLGFADSAVRLGGLPLPEMPAWLVSELSQLLRDASAGLKSGSQESRLLATELRLRALAADAGGILSLSRGGAIRRIEDVDEKVKPFSVSVDGADAWGNLAGVVAVRRLLQATDAAGLAALRNGEASPEALRAWVGLQEQLSAFTDVDTATDLLAGGERAAGVAANVADAAKAGTLSARIAPFAEGAERISGPVGFAANLVVAVGPSQYKNPGRDYANRFFAGLAVAGFAMGPEGAPLVLIAAGWQITNWTIDNWPTISKDAVQLGRVAWHGYEDLGRVENEALSRAGSGIARGTESIAGASVRTVKDIGHDVDPRNWL